MNPQLTKRIKMGAMMFFQYAVWGAWTPILSATLTARTHASGAEVGAVYGVLWLACIITPFVGGQLVDRLMPSQVYLGIAGIVMTISAYMMSMQQTVGTMFSGGLITWMWIWSIAFAPTIGIANSLVMYHLSKEGTSPDAQERDFSLIRTCGTIGWALASLVLAYYLTHKPAAAPGAFVPYEEMQLAAVLGIVLTIVSFLLPHTPPAKTSKDPWAFTKAFRMFTTVPGFAVFMFISFLISTEFQFYYVFSSPFMEQGMHIAHAYVSPYKSIAQWAEILSLAVLTPLSLKYLGTRTTLVIGALAWPLRYFIWTFYAKLPVWMILASMSFHGIGFAFVFVTSYIYIDRVSPRDIRGSAQSLYTLVTLGIGNYLGTLFSGWLRDHYAHGDVVDWPKVFIVPAILTTICGLAFLFTFKEPAARDADFVEEAAVPIEG